MSQFGFDVHITCLMSITVIFISGFKNSRQYFVVFESLVEFEENICKIVEMVVSFSSWQLEPMVRLG